MQHRKGWETVLLAPIITQVSNWRNSVQYNHVRKSRHITTVHHGLSHIRLTKCDKNHIKKRHDHANTPQRDAQTQA